MPMPASKTEKLLDVCISNSMLTLLAPMLQYLHSQQTISWSRESLLAPSTQLQLLQLIAKHAIRKSSERYLALKSRLNSKEAWNECSVDLVHGLLLMFIVLTK